MTIRCFGCRLSGLPVHEIKLVVDAPPLQYCIQLFKLSVLALPIAYHGCYTGDVFHDDGKQREYFPVFHFKHRFPIATLKFLRTRP
ncbi:hypothetical protein L596_021877 [Steinernema carpocapsae]|uniref:Uncharacterized protein n=1 Tax=Steinernema carpocapsae TaxID=34508 RepID=A0A4U5MK28_STECR|nr:hypothetical protein L596_021877 [Steinernema carpocapsae]